VFLYSMHKFAHLDTVYHHLSTSNWGWFFPPSFVDKSGISSKVFAIISGLVPCGDETPPCPTCGDATEFQADSSRAFGWRYRCVRSKSAKSRKSKNRRCHGSVAATKNTWFDDSNAIVDGMYVFFQPLCQMMSFRARMCLLGSRKQNCTFRLYFICPIYANFSPIFDRT